MTPAAASVSLPAGNATRDMLVDFLKTESVKIYVKDLMSPFVTIVYNEIYPYVWMICLYHVFLIFMTLLNLYMLHKLSVNFQR
jgi:hypothetical protein